MTNTRTLPILRCEQDMCKEVQDTVVREQGLRIILGDSGGEENFAFIRTIPGEPRPLIFGLLYTTRLISGLNDVLRLTVENQLAKVRVTDTCELHQKLERLRPTMRLVTGVCGPEEGALGTWQACDLPPIESSYTVEAGGIRRAIQSLNANMEIYRVTGGTHGAALAKFDGSLRVLAEDVGRHNAVDRVIGKGLEANLDLASLMLVCTGRLTSDLVLKAAVARIPLLASISAAVDSGVELADAAGISLVGFVRGSRMNVYTHPNRLTMHAT
ncbi:MAG: formate dehydrogenase accessory sulfurtransferase FdhD [Candidatus Hodarchaeota archaeon]